MYSDLRLAKQELLVACGILVPSTEEDWFQPIDDASFRGEVIDVIRPKLCD